MHHLIPTFYYRALFEVHHNELTSKHHKSQVDVKVPTHDQINLIKYYLGKNFKIWPCAN